MIFDEDINKLIKDLEKEMIESREEDQFGYAKQSGPSIYNSIIKRLRDINITGHHDVEEYHEN